MIRRILPLSLLSAALAICLAGASSARAADEAKGSVSGKVTTAAGEVPKDATGNNPISKAYVMKAEDAPTSRPAGGGGGRPDYEGKAVAKGEVKAGAYKIEGVPAGKYVIVVVITGQGNGRANDVEVTAGKDTAVPDIKLRARGGGNRPTPAPAAGQ